MVVNLTVSWTSTCLIVFIVLQPIYHHVRAVIAVILLLLVSLAICFYNFNYGYSQGDIMSFSPFSAACVSFFAQLRYSHQIKLTQGFYPRVFYKRFPIKGISIKHPDIDLPHSGQDTIMTIQAFLGLVLGMSIPLFIGIAMRA